jgi:hypothetical protein
MSEEMGRRNARVNKLLLWASISDSDPIEDLQVFGCTFTEWYVSRLAHCEECETCQEMYGALLRRALEQHHAVIDAILKSGSTIEAIRTALKVLPHDDADAAALRDMPTGHTKH